jgi:(2Fe-2S) ferredoxin
MPTKVSQQFASLALKAEEWLRARAADSPIRIQVGSATCEQAAGADDVLTEFRKHLVASGRTDILLHRTGCTGRCSREPIVGVMVPGQMPVKYERVDRTAVHEIFTNHILGGKPLLDHVLDGPVERIAEYEILICGSARCGWKGAKSFAVVLTEKLAAAGIGLQKARVTAGSCFGACNLEDASNRSHLLIRPDKVLYRVVDEADLDEIISGSRCQARPSGASSLRYTAMWPSSTARAVLPCATAAYSIRKVSKSIFITVASRP